MTNLVREMVQIPEMIRKLAKDRWELEKQLAKQLTKKNDEKEIMRLEENLYHTDCELEWLRNRQTVTVATINLIAGLKTEEAQTVLQAFFETRKDKQESERETKQETTKKNDETPKCTKSKENGKTQNNLETRVFEIKKVEPGKKENVWAKAIGEDGAEYMICGKNENRKLLLEAAEKKAEIKYRTMSGKKLFAIRVNIA